MSTLTQNQIDLYHRYIEYYRSEFGYTQDGKFIQSAKAHITDEQVPHLETEYGPDIVVAYLILQARQQALQGSSMGPTSLLVENHKQIYDWIMKIFPISERSCNSLAEYHQLFDQLEKM